MELSKRQKEILKVLLREERYFTARELAVRLGVSVRTIYSELTAIEHVLDLHQLQMERMPRFGIQITGENEHKKRLRNELTKSIDIYSSTPRGRQSKIIRYLFEIQASIDVEDLAEVYFISRSTLLNDLKEIERNYLKRHKLRLIKNNQGIYIEGNERDIQELFIELDQENLDLKSAQSGYLFDFKNSLHANYEAHFIYKAWDEVKLLIQESKTEVGEHIYMSILNRLVVLLHRINQGYHLDVESVQDISHDQESYLISEKILNSIADSDDLEFKEGDLLYLSKSIYGSGIRLIEHSGVANAIYKDEVSHFVERMSRVLDVDILDDSELIEMISNHFESMVRRLKNKIHINNPMTNQIRKTYSYLFGLCWIAIGELEKKMQIKFTDDEIAYLTIYVQAAVERKRKSKRILIVCHAGIGTSEFVRQRISQIVPLLDIVEVLSLVEFDQYDYSSVDFIITSIPLNIARIDVPVVNVSPILTDNDLRLISAMYTELIIDDDRKDQNLLDEPLLELNSVVDSDGIWVDQNLISREEVLSFLNKKLLTKDAVTSDFIQSVYDRESLSVTSHANGIAIPHGNSEFVKQTNIMIVKTLKPVTWGEYCVDSIILIAIAEADLGRARSILKDIYKIVENKESVNYYLSGSKEEIRKKIRGETND